MDIHGSSFIEGLAGAALVTCFPFFGWMLAVNGFGQYPGTGGLSHSSRTAKKKSMRQMSGFYGIF
jgi:hypothetical protein